MQPIDDVLQRAVTDLANVNFDADSWKQLSLPVLGSWVRKAAERAAPALRSSCNAAAHLIGLILPQKLHHPLTIWLGQWVFGRIIAEQTRTDQYPSLSTGVGFNIRQGLYQPHAGQSEASVQSSSLGRCSAQKWGMQPPYPQWDTPQWWHPHIAVT